MIPFGQGFRDWLIDESEYQTLAHIVVNDLCARDDEGQYLGSYRNIKKHLQAHHLGRQPGVDRLIEALREASAVYHGRIETRR